MVWWKLLSRKLKTLQALSWREQQLLGQAWLWFWPITLSLRCRGFQHTQSLLSEPRSPVANVQVESDWETIRAVTRAVRIAARYFPWSNCLRSSLVLWWLLRRRGIAGELYVGARQEDRQFSAHAWIEYQGIVLNDQSDVRERYATFGSLTR